jgi:predicted nuclease with TOPRIM domain
MTEPTPTPVASELRALSEGIAALRDELAALRDEVAALDRKMDDLTVRVTLMSGELHEVEEGVEDLEKGWRR